MTVERELGELTSAVKTLVKSQDKMTDKVDEMHSTQAVLIDAHERNKKISFYAITAGITGFGTALWGLITSGSIH